MAKRIQLVTGTVLLAAVAVAAVSHASPDGIITPLNPMVTYTHGPFTGANPSNNIPGQTEPDCDLVPGTCDDFALQIDLPPGYKAAHPNFIVTVQIEWDPTNPGNDFDLYVQDPVTGMSVVSPSATSGNPEITAIPVEDGVRDFRVRVVVYSVVNTSYTGTISLGEPATTGVGIYALSTDVWSCNTHLEGVSEIPGPPPTLFDHSNDGEPSCKFDPNGRAYVTAIAGVPAGAGLWATSDACGQTYEFLGAVDAGAGGGDSDVEVATVPNVLGNYNVYLSSLTLANITSAVSFDGGATYTVTPISTPAPVDDRQWNAAWGSSICYLSYRQGATQPGNLLEVVRLDYTGLGAPVIAGPFNVWDPIQNPPLASKELGNMVTDRRPLPEGSPPLMAGPDGQGAVYHGFVQSGSQVWVAVSKTFGVTWENHRVWDGGAGVTYHHKFIWLAVDRDGNVYVVFSDDHNVYYSVSSDQAATWSLPIRVNLGGPSRTSIYPHIAAGSAGRIAVAWYGHSGSSSQDPDANWKVFVARCENALDPLPAFEEKLVSDRDFHTGVVCQDGLDCSCCRELTECFDVDIHPVEGSAFVTYGAFGAGGTYITRQLAGSSSIEGVDVPDRSGDCPFPPDCNLTLCVGDFCTCPGCISVEDLDSEDSPPPPRPDQNIRAIGVSEPFQNPAGPNVLVFSMVVESLNPNDLPPNGFWRIIFNAGGAQHFVRVVNCAVGGLSGEYGHFETGSVTDGPLDDFTLSDDGVICMIVDRANVGDPQPGQQISGINGDTRIQVGNCPGSPGGFAPIDVTNSGGYLVMGNEACATTSSPGSEQASPAAFSFLLAGPNPFAGETRLTYSLPEQARVRIDVYNVAGQRVSTLINRDQEVGLHDLAFKPRSQGLGSGVYWLRIKAGRFEKEIRLVSLE